MVPRTPQLAEGGVAGDAQHPRIERAPPWVEAGGVPPQPLEGLLDDVVSRPVAHDATPDGPYRRSQPLEDRGQGVATAGRHLGHDSSLVHLAFDSPAKPGRSGSGRWS